MLETFNLRQQLDITRKELAHSLYQQDAACRVIARLVRERDEALQMLQAYKAQQPTATSSMSKNSNSSANDGMDVEEPETGKDHANQTEELGISSEMLNEMNALCKSLSTQRKQRKPSPQLTSKDDIMRFEEIVAHEIYPGDAGLSTNRLSSFHVVSRQNDENDMSSLPSIALSGSTSGSISVLHDIEHTGRVYAKLSQAHTSAVTVLSFNATIASQSQETIADNSQLFFSGGNDAIVKCWRRNDQGGGYTESFRYARHSQSIAALAVHPSSKYSIII